MKQPTKKSFGWNNWSGWPSKEKQDAYYEALKAWENRPRNPVLGRKRTREIHPSWEPYLKLFDSSTTLRSRGAFCRASGVNRATLSGAMCRKITVAMEEKLSIWAENLSMQIPQDETARRI